MVTAGIADLCGTGGLSLVATAVYEAGKFISNAANLAAFLKLTKAEQAKVVLAVVDGDDLDTLLG